MRPPAFRVSLSELALAGGGGAELGRPSLLIVDDDAAMRATLTCYFERCRFHVLAAASLAEAKAFFDTRKSWTLLLADYHLPDGFGTELHAWMRESNPATPIPFLLMSGSVDGQLLSQGIEYLAKPFTLFQLDAAVRRVLGEAVPGSPLASRRT